MVFKSIHMFSLRAMALKAGVGARVPQSRQGTEKILSQYLNVPLWDSDGASLPALRWALSLQNGRNGSGTSCYTTIHKYITYIRPAGVKLAGLYKMDHRSQGLCHACLQVVETSIVQNTAAAKSRQLAEVLYFIQTMTTSWPCQQEVTSISRASLGEH